LKKKRFRLAAVAKRMGADQQCHPHASTCALSTRHNPAARFKQSARAAAAQQPQLPHAPLALLYSTGGGQANGEPVRTHLCRSRNENHRDPEGDGCRASIWR